MKKWFSKQYILLTISLIIGILVLLLGSSYAYYIIRLTGNDTENNTSIKITNLNLDISNVSGELKLCKSYPITDTEGLSCSPYNFTLTNNNKTNVEYYLNLETNSTAPKESIKVAFATCTDTNCSNPTYKVAKLSEMVNNLDNEISKYSGDLLMAESTFAEGESKTYSIIMWIDEESEYQGATFTTYIAAITYTKDPNELIYKASFDLEGNEAWTSEICKASDGYTINGTKCEKEINVKNQLETIPSVEVNNNTLSWYTDKTFTTTVTTDMGYSLKKNPVYYLDLVPRCTLTLSGSKVVANHYGAYDRTYYGWSPTYEGENSTSIDVSFGTTDNVVYNYYVKDTKERTNTCSIDIAKITVGSKYEFRGSAHSKPVASGSCVCQDTSVSCSCTTSGPYCGGGVKYNYCTTTIKRFCDAGEEEYLEDNDVKCRAKVATYTCPTGYKNYSNKYCYKY